MLTNAELDIIGQMDREVYQQRIIALFKNGAPTDLQWREMAFAVLCTSEGLDADEVEAIERTLIAMGREGTPMSEPLTQNNPMHLLVKMFRVGLFGLYGSTVFLTGLLCVLLLTRDEEYATYQGYLQGIHVAVLSQVCTNTLVLPEHLDRIWHARRAHPIHWARALTCDDVRAVHPAGPPPIGGGYRYGL